MARHGSRGLSSYKYDALLMKMAEAAERDGGFKSDAIKTEFMKNLNGITAANVANGYGMLTGQGADQHYGIGERAYQRNQSLFDQAAVDGGTISYQFSGEARATESGDGKDFQKNPDTLYFHKVQNPDGTEKTPGTKAYGIANDYQNFVANDEIIAGAEETIGDNADIKRASHDLLSQVFTDEFLAKLENGEYTWYNTADGTKKGAENCAPGADASKDANACGEGSKKIKNEYNAAMNLYNLYIIAADMQNENTGDHTFDFNQYFQGEYAQDAKLFAWPVFR